MAVIMILNSAVEKKLRRSYFDPLSTNGVLGAHPIGEASVRPERRVQRGSRRGTDALTAEFGIMSRV